MNWYLKVVRDNYFNFTGRARRYEYWMFMLVYFGIMVVASFIDAALGTAFISSVLALLHIIPSIAVGARRLHDIDKSGWWQLISLIPVIGWVLALFWACKDGETGPNRFGNDPKENE